MWYFFGSYAIIEMNKGSIGYARFKDSTITTSALNVGEIYQAFLRKYGKETADKWLEEINFELLEITPEIIVEAVHFRFINKKKNMSLVDCVGYILSLKHNLKFLTGDNQFKDAPNAEFVK